MSGIDGYYIGDDVRAINTDWFNQNTITVNRITYKEIYHVIHLFNFAGVGMSLVQYLGYFFSKDIKNIYLIIDIFEFLDLLRNKMILKKYMIFFFLKWIFKKI